MLENRLKRAAGVASTRRCAHPETVSMRMCRWRYATVAGRATRLPDYPPALRSGAARRVRHIMPRRIVPLRRPTVQTVGDDTCRSISIDRAHDVVHPRTGSRLK
ncbi:hypothetical protein BCCH1_61910 [Burkholderia contaminans]|jgi:hypothetical protein|uniref:Uncharacterized protein n=2 Tax=Burkholderia contaminans TaxID=488447 RepID=A0A250LJF3_9BURK|nr:hypothetical protein WR31_26400 [Burkholderia contaminans LMG 23361]BBA43691.1 hypothetical protein BCCH1_61910 [Burkholderia contaminans]